MGNLLNTKEIISTLITIIFFTIEAILHYNIGKTGNISFFSFSKDERSLKNIIYNCNICHSFNLSHALY